MKVTDVLEDFLQYFDVYKVAPNSPYYVFTFSGAQVPLLTELDIYGRFHEYLVRQNAFSDERSPTFWANELADSLGFMYSFSCPYYSEDEEYDDSWIKHAISEFYFNPQKRRVRA